MRYLVILFALLTVSGCASTDYIQYAKAQEAIEVSKSQAQAARYQALGQIAKDGDSTSKVAAVMALAFSPSEGGNSQASTMAAPPPNQALQWASILVPGLTQIYGIRSNASVAMRSSDNAAATNIATTNAFVGMASKIQAPGAIHTTSGNSGANSGGTSGNSGANSGTTAGNSGANSGTIAGNSGANSGTTAGNSGANSGTIAGNSGANSGNATATPTVVNQPAPTIVTQPAPIIVQPATPIVVTQPSPIIVQPPKP